MPLQPSDRLNKAAVAAAIVMLLMAMLLPVCHLHPLLDKGAPDHCAICVSLHAAAPWGVHVPLAAALLQTGRVFVIAIPALRGSTEHLAPARSPPTVAC